MSMKDLVSLGWLGCWDELYIYRQRLADTGQIPIGSLNDRLKLSNCWFLCRRPKILRVEKLITPVKDFQQL
jgi:hypothetical protein